MKFAIASLLATSNAMTIRNQAGAAPACTDNFTRV